MLRGLFFLFNIGFILFFSLTIFKGGPRKEEFALIGLAFLSISLLNMAVCSSFMRWRFPAVLTVLQFLAQAGNFILILIGLVILGTGRTVGGSLFLATAFVSLVMIFSLKEQEKSIPKKTLQGHPADIHSRRLRGWADFFDGLMAMSGYVAAIIGAVVLLAFLGFPPKFKGHHDDIISYSCIFLSISLMAFFVCRVLKKRYAALSELVFYGMDVQEAKAAIGGIVESGTLAVKVTELLQVYYSNNKTEIKRLEADLRVVLAHKYGFNPAFISQFMPDNNEQNSFLITKMHRNGENPETAAQKVYERIVASGLRWSSDVFSRDIRTNKEIPKDFNPYAFASKKDAVFTLAFFSMMFFSLFGVFGNALIPSTAWYSTASILSVAVGLSFALRARDRWKKGLIEALPGRKKPGVFSLSLAVITFMLIFWFGIMLGVGSLINKVVGVEGVQVYDVRKDGGSKTGRPYLRIENTGVLVFVRFYPQPAHYDEMAEHEQLEFKTKTSWFGDELVGYHFHN